MDGCIFCRMVAGVIPATRVYEDERTVAFLNLFPANRGHLLVIPRAQKLLHIRTLADICRVVSRENVREHLLAAKTAEEAWAALAEGDAARR